MSVEYLLFENTQYNLTLTDAIRQFLSDSHELSETISILKSGFVGGMPFSAIILLVFSFLICVCGRKLLPVIKVTFFFAVGYIVGVCFAAPFISAYFDIPTAVMGMTLGVVSAVLSRVLYLLLYTLFPALSIFLWLYSGMLAGNAVVGAVAASVAVILAFYFRTYVEALGTSVLGAIGVVGAIELMIVPLGISLSSLGILFVVAFSLVGFIRQIRIEK